MKRNHQNTLLIATFSTFAVLASCVHSPLTIIDEETPIVIVDTTVIIPIDECSEDTTYFENDVLPILLTNCAISGCHDAETHEEGIVLSSYSQVMSDDDLVKPGDPGDSKLIEVLFESGDDKMPPSPYPSLTSAEVAILTSWINQGALNNSCDACDSSDVNYSIVVSNIMSSYCIGCHGTVSPSASLDLTDYSGVAFSASNGSLLSSLYATDGYSLMPYGSSALPQCKIDQIEAWINDGYPNN